MTVTLPDKGDLVAVRNLLTHLNPNEARGVSTLSDKLTRYLRSVELADKHWHAVNVSAAFINGVRHNGAKTPAATARRFYSSLSTPALRQYATLFGLDYDGYDSVEDIVEALVSKHVESVS